MPNAFFRPQVFLLSLLLAGVCFGAPTGSVDGPDPCPPPRGGALAALSSELCRALATVPVGTLVVAAPTKSDAPLQPKGELERRVSRVVAGALRVQASPEVATVGRARALASTSGSLLHLTTELRQGKLRVAADLYRVPRSFWDRVRDPSPEPSRHAFAEATLDAELRSLLPSVPLVARHIHRGVSDEPQPLAVACGDLDGDGAQEIVLVGRHRIRIGRIRQARFVTSRTLGWSELSPLSRSPLRQPLGSAWLSGPGQVDLGISDRLDAIRLLGTNPPQKLGRRLPWPGGGCAPFSALGVRAELGGCAAADPAPRVTQMPPESDAVAGSVILGPDNQTTVVRAARVLNQGIVELRDERGRQARTTNAGAQLAVADLDADGSAELLSSVDTLDPTADALVVHTWTSGGAVMERMRLGVPTGVFALGVCDWEDSTSMRPIVVATAGSVWVVR